MTLIRICFFVLSTLGSFQLIRKISDDKINIYFLPSLTIAMQVTVLFFAGVLNLLPEISVVLYLLGLAGLVTAFIKNKNPGFLRSYCNDGYILLILAIIVMGISVWGKVFVHVDNFSHWAIVVRNMLDVDHYPNFESSVIKFQQYPLGSTTYIYYFAKMIGTGEPVQMMAQAYMILAALLPLFSMVQKRSIKTDLIFLALANFVFVYNIKVEDLLVDTLLPVVGFCALLFAKEHCTENADKSSFWLLSCYLVELTQIKNSGLFFVAAVILTGFKHYWKKERRLNNIFSAAFPFLTLVIWQKHCEYVFSSAAKTKHAMTARNYYSVFGKKSAEDVITICKGMLKLSVTFKDVWVMLGIAVLLGCFVFLFYREAFKDYKKLFIFSLVLYVCYQLGMLGMYLFSMPGREATKLAGSERYLKTVLLAVLLMYMAFALKVISSDTIDRKISLVLSAAVIVCVFSYGFISQGRIQLAPLAESNSEEKAWRDIRMRVEDSIETYSIPMHESYCVFVAGQDAKNFRYFVNVLKYLSQSTEVESRTVEENDDLNGISSKYIFVYDKDNEIINSWIRETYPDQTGNDVIIRE